MEKVTIYTDGRKFTLDEFVEEFERMKAERKPNYSDKLLLEEQLDNANHIIHQYQQHYASHTFKKNV